ncbi:hypothetical protein C0063_14925 [Pseudoxanthomonas sp. KAs_5_3]|nr:hypothetical protein C0063_14925 [Pseudoxanthomonas sp. KAs_5_3]
MKYERSFLETIFAERGVEALQQLQADGRARFNAVALAALSQMFSDDDAKVIDCERLVGAVEGGIYDYREHAKFFPILEALQREGNAP